MSPKKIGLIAHTGKPGVAKLIHGVLEELNRFSMSILIEKETAAIAGRRSDFTIAQLGAEADLLVVLGGDGTILNVAGELRETIKPIFGINVGSLGFLTCSNSSAYREAVQSIVEGRIDFTERTMLEVRVPQTKGAEQRMLGLNDAVFTRGELSRLVRLHVRVNG